jgi:proteasome lid subunit RPN8/RPN11
MMLTNEQVFEIKKAFVASYPQEAVFLLTKSGLRQVPNVAPNPEEDFAVSREDTIEAQREGLLAVIHSHPDGQEFPSLSDMEHQVASNVPWAIAVCNGEECADLFWFGTEQREPLVGRGFRFGVTDCYSIIRDYYHDEKGIELPEFPREWEFWNKGKSLYVDGFGKAGFKVIDESEIQEGDVFLSQIRSPVPNHGGVYLGNGLIIHHTTSTLPVDMSKLSAREPITRWQQYITHWLRYMG